MTALSRYVKPVREMSVIREILQRELGGKPEDVDCCGHDTYQFTVCNRKRNVMVCIPWYLLNDYKASIPAVNEAGRAIVNKLGHLYALE